MMQKKQLPKQQRRKRKDPQSRDFKCKCGKSYLSYAAVYTHVKNKHNGDKEFEDSIMKPEKEKLKRGRPRDKKKIVISSETQILSICEQTTLLIYDQLKEHKDTFKHHIILQGNEEMSQVDFDLQYNRLNKIKPVKYNLLQDQSRRDHSSDSQSEQDNRIFQKFLKGVIKHFSAQISARVSYVINYFSQLYEEINFEDKNEIDLHLKDLNEMEIWEGQNEINEIVYRAMLRWLEILRKEGNEEEE